MVKWENDTTNNNNSSKNNDREFAVFVWDRVAIVSRYSKGIVILKFNNTFVIDISPQNILRRPYKVCVYCIAPSIGQMNYVEHIINGVARLMGILMVSPGVFAEKKF